MTTAEPKIAKAASREARASFRWDDPLRFDDQLTEDERLIRDTARGYAQDKLLPRVIEAYMEEKTDRAIFGSAVVIRGSLFRGPGARSLYGAWADAGASGKSKGPWSHPFFAHVIRAAIASRRMLPCKIAHGENLPGWQFLLRHT